MAGRPVPSGHQEEETAKDHGLKQSPARPPGRLPSIDETQPDGPGPASRRGSVLGPASSFSRRNSLAGPGAGLGGWRPSLGPLPTLVSRVSFSGLTLAAARWAAPSYRTESAPRERWEAARAQRILEAALEEELSDACYSSAEAGRLAPEMCELVRMRMRELSPLRYKLVCSVVLGLRAGQGVRVVSRALWDAARDGLATAAVTNASLFALATVHRLYCE
ncbi:dynein light chain Tctex-type 4 [Physeter macrocephalus]|uniref:Dynein light chain Tctex-type 4 n=1 Tax=Physeter macrocephalus TaxID=9755 RepID=A0A2Y9EY51_PHYMC|nr:dynein light chain Tctex-type 4 [Physeter catodon]XP_028345231.1 dynein light chain Tctex-type 4 [Physeter catodon]XP_028345232.1 dynein light chain Tctex-type 4 [Physeter catodon]XP_028345233.1 dynein light chain Tctex-type 4 [Physeter catodon]XP_054940631.1 dynein light chain Tctex-type 4 [Physeter catodon]|eukprot:XP_007110727.1 tctex1 domain-containing protein 4 [Physeter catodon]